MRTGEGTPRNEWIRQKDSKRNKGVWHNKDGTGRDIWQHIWRKRRWIATTAIRIQSKSMIGGIRCSGQRSRIKKLYKWTREINLIPNPTIEERNGGWECLRSGSIRSKGGREKVGKHVIAKPMRKGEGTNIILKILTLNIIKFVYSKTRNLDWLKFYERWLVTDEMQEHNTYEL